MMQLREFGLHVSQLDSPLTGKQLLNGKSEFDLNAFIISTRKNPKWLDKKSTTKSPTIALLKFESGAVSAKYFQIEMKAELKLPKIVRETLKKYTFPAAEKFVKKAQSQQTKKVRNTDESKAMALFAIEAGQ